MSVCIVLVSKLNNITLYETQHLLVKEKIGGITSKYLGSQRNSRPVRGEEWSATSSTPSRSQQWLWTPASRREDALAIGVPKL